MQKTKSYDGLSAANPSDATISKSRLGAGMIKHVFDKIVEGLTKTLTIARGGQASHRWSEAESINFFETKNNKVKAGYSKNLPKSPERL